MSKVSVFDAFEARPSGRPCRSGCGSYVWWAAVVIVFGFLAWKLEWIAWNGDATPDNPPPVVANPETKPVVPAGQTVADAGVRTGEEVTAIARKEFARAPEKNAAAAEVFARGKEAFDAAPQRLPEAINEFKSGADNYPHTLEGLNCARALIQIYTDQKEFYKAQEYISRLLLSSVSVELKDTLRDFLNTEIAGNVLYNPRQLAGGFFETYTVQPSDLLSKIAARYAIPWQGIVQINRLPSETVRAGQILKLPKKDPAPRAFHVMVSKSERRLYLIGGLALDGKIPMVWKFYKVGVGQDDSTPNGKFRIVSRVEKPDWTDPISGKLVKFGDPNHRIGSRWVGFEVPGRTGAGYGIHGTDEPESIGKAASLGCIRMHNHEVEELSDYLKEGHSTVFVNP